MNTEDALFRAILLDPDDDTPRLIYADWLEDQGDDSQQARARFIRAQIEADRLAPRRWWYDKTTDPRRAPLDELAGRLWDQHLHEWFGPATHNWPATLCVRGFLHPLVSAGGWAQAVDALDDRRQDSPWPLGPIVSVSLAHAPEEDDPDFEHPDRLSKMPGLASWGELSLTKLNDSEELDRLRILLTSPHLTNLVGFRAVRSWIADEGVAALSEAPAGFRLHRLSLDDCGVGDKGVQRLARDPAFADLRELTLCESAGEEAVVELLGSPNLGNVQT